MRGEIERPADRLASGRPAGPLVPARRRGPLTAQRCWMLTVLGLTVVAPLVAGALHLLTDVAAADPPSLPPTPRAAPVVLVRERGGYTPTPVLRSTPLPTLTPGPGEPTPQEAPPAAASAADRRPAAMPSTARRGDAATPARSAPPATARPLQPLAAASPPRPSATPGVSAPTATPTTTAAVLPPRRTATATPTLAPASPVPSATAVPPTRVPSPTSPPPTAAPAPAVDLARRDDKGDGGSSTAPAPPSVPVAAASYKLGDAVAITEVLKGFAFTAHWISSPEGPYATDWYPRSTTERCANSYRMPLAMPVAGKWRLASQRAPMGGALYTLIGDLDDGNSVAFTHVDPDVLTGRAPANTVVGFVGISGLEPFNAAGLNPSHAHTAWNDRMIPGWNGDQGNRPARDFFAHYGFRVELRDPALEASPQSYMAGRSCGGMP